MTDAADAAWADAGVTATGLIYSVPAPRWRRVLFGRLPVLRRFARARVVVVTSPVEPDGSRPVSGSRRIM